MEEVKVAEKLTSLESSLTSPDDNLHNGDSSTKLISKGKVELSSKNPTNYIFPTMHDASTLLLNQASLEEKSQVDQVKFSKYGSDYSTKIVEQSDLNRGHINTTAPSKSVKEAVSKFGGIVDWKAHRIQIVERQKLMDQELEKACKEIPEYKRCSEAAEEAKAKVLNELDSTKRLTEELKLNLERAQTEENQAKQDSELAKLRFVELEQGIADDASIAVKAHLKVSKARHAAALSELKSVKVETLKKEYDSLVREKDLAVNKFEGAMAASKEAEQTVEELTIELIAAKELFKSSHTFQLEVEEKRIGAALAREQDSINWVMELKHAHEEIQRLNWQIILVKDSTPKLNSASTQLLDLRNELASYTILELALIQMKEKEAREKKCELPKQLQLLATDAKQTKSLSQTAREEMQKAKEEAEQAKAAARTIKSLLIATQKEIEASKASKRLALAAIKALKESETTRTTIEMDPPSRVTISLEDYHELSKHAREAEEQADISVSASLSQIKIAKEAESKSLAKLEEVNREIIAITEVLNTAKEKAEKAKESKLGVEQELRKWREEHEWMNKANESHRNAIKG